jgi:hypothetical protein
MITLSAILVCSWGYEQTNVDFYQVVGLTPKSVRLRKLKKNQQWRLCAITGEPDHTAGGWALPERNAFDGLEFMRRVGNDGESVKLSDYQTATLWDGEAEPFTCYA